MTALLPENPATKKVAREAEESETLRFHPSARNTIGVELELQILDSVTGDLAPGSVRILKVCEQEKVEGVSAELMQSMIEIKTGICANVVEARDQLLPVLRKVRNIAHSLGYQLALGGTHPFHRGTSAAVYPAERYERIQERLAWLTYQRVVFGLHVHVGMPGGDMAMGVISMLVRYLPHLLAASASSPFWHGEDTGLASSRSALYRMLPHSGVPMYFYNWKEFRNFYRVMKDTGAIHSTKDIYWDIRPCPSFGTIEFRVCDMPLTLSTVFGVTALIHCLTISAQRLLEDRPLLRRGDVRRHWMAVENLWLATRHGLKGMHIRTPSGKRRSLAQDLSELIERLMPIAEETGDAAFLKALRPGEQPETGADRLRRIFRETGDWKAVTTDMTQRWSKELQPAGEAACAN
ncbi:MAG: YbdK family carboxylate-amine ligase [Planctomycetaceae bacterium]|nr:YbdK family carboxylate-amine ligase [Planctomycetaceae bacterium]